MPACRRHNAAIIPGLLSSARRDRRGTAAAVARPILTTLALRQTATGLLARLCRVFLVAAAGVQVGCAFTQPAVSRATARTAFTSMAGSKGRKSGKHKTQSDVGDMSEDALIQAARKGKQFDSSGERVLDRGEYKQFKYCAQCKNIMVWRKAWERSWDDVKFCSDKCRKASKPRPSAPAAAN